MFITRDNVPLVVFISLCLYGIVGMFWSFPPDESEHNSEQFPMQLLYAHRALLSAHVPSQDQRHVRIAGAIEPATLPPVQTYLLDVRIFNKIPCVPWQDGEGFEVQNPKKRFHIISGSSMILLRALLSAMGLLSPA